MTGAVRIKSWHGATKSSTQRGYGYRWQKVADMALKAMTVKATREAVPTPAVNTAHAADDRPHG